MNSFDFERRNLRGIWGMSKKKLNWVLKDKDDVHVFMNSVFPLAKRRGFYHHLCVGRKRPKSGDMMKPKALEAFNVFGKKWETRLS